MNFDEPFYRLPLRFDAALLESELRALQDDAWVAHPQRFTGNDYVPLVTPSGAITNEFAGPMAPTRFLKASPYLQEVMATLDCVWGRARLMGLAPGASVPPHVDTNYYWRTHIRVHIPIVTNPDVSFTCGESTVHMAPGECWLFDTFRPHQVHNAGSQKRIHLVADTIGGERLWDLVHAARQPAMAGREPQLLARGTGGGRLRFEAANFPTVMNPWEVRVQVDDLLGRTEPTPALDYVRLRLDRLVSSWQATWAEHEDRPAGLPIYRALIAAVVKDLDAIPGSGSLTLSNGIQLMKVLVESVFENMVENERVKASKAAARAAARTPAAA